MAKDRTLEEGAMSCMALAGLGTAKNLHSNHSQMSYLSLLFYRQILSKYDFTRIQTELV